MILKKLPNWSCNLKITNFGYEYCQNSVNCQSRDLKKFNLNLTNVSVLDHVTFKILLKKLVKTEQFGHVTLKFYNLDHV